MNRRFPLTRRVVSTGAVGFLAIALVWIVVALNHDRDLIETVSLVSTVVLSAFAAGLTLSAAARIPVGEPLRTRWALLGGGISLYACGQGVRIYYEHFAGMPAPYPGIADILFIGSSIALAIALFDAMIAVRRVGIMNGPLIAAVVVSLSLLAVQADLLLVDVFTTDTLSPFARAVTLYRPVGDVLLCVLPAIYVVFAVAVQGGRLGWPWVPVSAGVITIALADATYAWLSWEGQYRPGGITDFGLMIGYMLLALGALIHMEVDHEDEVATPDSSVATETTEAASA